MQTPYSKKNADLSDAAHLVARSRIYPQIFGCDESMLKYDDATLLHESDRGKILDGEMGVDRIVNVSVTGFRFPIVFTVQERFRRAKFAKYKDLTVTEYNRRTGQPSELYKINAGLFVYGYLSNDHRHFVDAICINTAQLLWQLSRHGIRYKTQENHRSNQCFLCFTFDALSKSGCLLWRKKQDAKY